MTRVMGRRPARGDDDAGAVAILVAVLTSAVLLTVGALTVDLGSAWAERVGLRSVAESAALAAAALLPEDSDRSARRIRDGLRYRLGLDVAIIISDTFGRPWRRGLTDVAIGVAGIQAVVDLRGTDDAKGRILQVTEVCVADELASADADAVVAALVIASAKGGAGARATLGAISDSIQAR